MNYPHFVDYDFSSPRMKEDYENTNTAKARNLDYINSVLDDCRIEVRKVQAMIPDNDKRLLHIKTPQADLGIGPVRYDFYYDENHSIDNQPLIELNEFMKTQKAEANDRLRRKARDMCAKTGQENPSGWTLAALRVATRFELQQ